MEKQLFIHSKYVNSWHSYLTMSFVSIHCLYCNSRLWPAWLCWYFHSYGIFLPVVPLDWSMLWFWLICHCILLWVFYIQSH